MRRPRTCSTSRRWRPYLCTSRSTRRLRTCTPRLPLRSADTPSRTVAREQSMRNHESPVWGDKWRPSCRSNERGETCTVAAPGSAGRSQGAATALLLSPAAVEHVGAAEGAALDSSSRGNRRPGAAYGVEHAPQAEAPRSGPGRSLQGYLRRSLVNLIRDDFRRAQREPPSTPLDEDAIAWTPSPLRHTLVREEMRRYQAALARLTPRSRAAIVGRFERGFSYERLARELGRPSAGAARLAGRRPDLTTLFAAGHFRSADPESAR